MPRGVTPLSCLVIAHRKGLPSWKWGAQRSRKKFELEIPLLGGDLRGG